MKPKSIVIAGNGPSLRGIDYARLPKDFDVYRCNQFYFEDQYFLGRKIKGVFFNFWTFFEQYYTLKAFLKKEYEIEQIYCSRMFWATEKDFSNNEVFNRIYPDVINVYDIVSSHQEIHTNLKFADLFLESRITSGVLMAVVAAIQGYTSLYITGIDFYENGAYAFEHKKKNALDLVYQYHQDSPKDLFHKKEIDLKILLDLQKMFDIEIYSLSPKSPLSEHFPLAPCVNHSFKIISKPLDYTNDIMIPPVKDPLKEEVPEENKEPNEESEIEEIELGFIARIKRILVKIKQKLGF